MRRLLLLAALLCSAAPREARADWEVKRRGTAALVSRALESLRTNPDQPTLAARIVKTATRDELAAALATLRRAAERSPTRYEARQAYAQLLLAAGRAAEAAEAFRAAASLRPQSATAALGHARALEVLGRNDEAFTAYDEALRRDRQPKGREGILRTIVALAARTGALEREIAGRKVLHAHRSDDARAALELAEALRRAGRPDEGAAVLQDLLARLRAPGRRTDVARQASRLWEAAGNDEAAEQTLEDSLKSVRSDADRTDIYQRLTAIGRRRDTLPALARRLERLVAVVGAGRGRLPEWEALARVREELGDFTGALEAARRAAALDSGNLALQRQIIATLDRLGRRAELTAAYQELERRWRGDLGLAFERIERQFRAGDRDAARSLFDRALRDFRGDTEATAKLADLASRWSEDDRVLAAWDAVLALSPLDERAIIGLGEAHFQRGRRELARRTWRRLLTAVRPRAEAHARLAELLGDHDLLDEAVVEASVAQKLDAHNPRPHRILARILERKKESDAAEAEWHVVLALSAGPGHAAERREARSSLVTLLLRNGRARLDREAHRLSERLEQNPDDRETVLFLVELELRRMDPGRALSRLRGAAERWPADAEIVTTLVRLLRQSRQLGEAVSRLEGLARTTPDRARDAYLQIADIELQRYSDQRALEFASKAAALSGDDAEALARIGEIRERAGDLDGADLTYRQVLARQGQGEVGAPKAAYALHRLLMRSGAANEASAVLRAFANVTSDDEVRAEILRKEIDVGEYLGTLPELERMIVRLGGRSASSKKVMLALAERMIPPLYRASATDVAARGALGRLGRWGLRALAELATDADAEPDLALVELLGMMGNPNAIPVLLRLANPAGRNARPGAAANRSSTVQVAATIALGRLGDRRAAPLLTTLASSPDIGVRAVALWALGRSGTPEATVLLEAAAADPRTDVTAVACLGLGRVRSQRSAERLLAIATDLRRFPRLRRAAVLGLALGDHVAQAPALVPLLDSPDLALARAAAAALGALKDRATLPALWQRALLGHGDSAQTAAVALRAFASPNGLADEARALRDSRFDVDALLDALAATPPELDATAAADFEALWVEHARDLESTLSRALDGPVELRRRALAVLDTRDDGLGLGTLTAALDVDGTAGGVEPSQDSTSATPGRTAALRAIGEGLRERLVAALEDADPIVRRRALRVASKISDARVTVSHLQAVLATASVADAGALAEAESAVLWAARALVSGGRLPGARLVEALRPLLADPSWERRLAVVRVLHVAGPAAVAELRHVLSDANPFVRAEATAALSVLTAGVPAARLPR